ncbi:MAG: glycosyltransferase family 4 protein [Prevotella sp.]|nr:glycosyltransferase family 4 protein [Prevotella sp.]
MRIVFLHHANVCRGGIERMLSVRANTFAEKMGYDVTLLTYEQNHEPYPYPLSLKVKCVDLDVKLYKAYKYPYPLRYLKKLLLRHQLSNAIRDFLKEAKADIVVCTDKDAHELRALIRAHTTEKLVVEAHTGMIDHEMQVRETRNIVRRFFAVIDLNRLKETVCQFNALIALTPDDAHKWGAFIRKTIIPNCLPEHPEQKADTSKDYKRAIAVGRLNHQKGFDLLLQAWRKVQERHTDWHLDIFGDGEDLAELSAKLPPHAAIHPSTPDIFVEYQQSDLLVCSSRWESFGLIIIEAMACGLPVVAFDCDNGPRNIITDGEDGLLARNGDTDDLAEKLCQMIGQKDQRQKMGITARQNAARFKSESIITQYDRFYKSLLEE